MNLTNDEAQFLIALAKRTAEIELCIQPPGKVATFPATDSDGVRQFLSRMRVANGNHPGRHKTTYNLFYSGYQLLRLDTYGNGIHINDDGTIIPARTPHIHIYDANEHDHDHHAFLLPDLFTNTKDDIRTLLDFLSYASVVDIEKLQVVQQGVMKDGHDIH